MSHPIVMWSRSIVSSTQDDFSNLLVPAVCARYFRNLLDLLDAAFEANLVIGRMFCLPCPLRGARRNDPNNCVGCPHLLHWVEQVETWMPYWHERLNFRANRIQILSLCRVRRDRACVACHRCKDGYFSPRSPTAIDAISTKLFHFRICPLSR